VTAADPGAPGEAASSGPREPAPPPRRPGASIFTIEGRAAPGLFVVGWLATIIGVALILPAIGAQAGLSRALLFVAGLATMTVGLVAGAGSQALERRARGIGGYTGPSPLLVFAASLTLTLLLVVVVGNVLVAVGMDPAGPASALVSVGLTAIAYIVLIRLLVVGTGGLSWHDMGLRRPSRQALQEVAWGAVVAAPVLFLTGLLALVLVTFLPRPPAVLPEATSVVDLAFLLIAAAVIAPISEELLFRGFSMTAWLQSVGPRKALVRSSLLFAGAHVVTITADTAGEGFLIALFAFVVRLPVAVALGWLYLRTRSLYGPIALHAVFNALQIVAQESQRQG
jgi:membrane protease YdiL (CAAX protease family)